MERAAEIVTPGRGGVRSGYPLTLPLSPAPPPRAGERRKIGGRACVDQLGHFCLGQAARLSPDQPGIDVENRCCRVSRQPLAPMAAVGVPAAPVMPAPTGVGRRIPRAMPVVGIRMIIAVIGSRSIVADKRDANANADKDPRLRRPRGNGHRGSPDPGDDERGKTIDPWSLCRNEHLSTPHFIRGDESRLDT